jgi:hypothetical protein
LLLAGVGCLYTQYISLVCDLYLLISSLLPPRGTGIAVYTRAPFSKTAVFTNVITFVVNIFFSHVVSFNNRLQQLLSCQRAARLFR